MGHPVNPISFRLGVIKSWNFLSSSLENKHHYFFFNSSSWNALSFFKRFFNLKSIEKLGLIFSHIKSFSSFNVTYYSIFFYDGFFESNNFLFYRIFNVHKFYRRMILVGRLFIKKHLFLFLRKIYFVSLFKTFKNFLIFYLKSKVYFFKKTYDLYLSIFLIEFFSFVINYRSINMFFFENHILFFRLKFLTITIKFFKNLKINSLFLRNNNYRNFKRYSLKRFFIFQSLVNYKFRLKTYNFLKKFILFSKNLKIKRFFIFKFFNKFFRSFFVFTFLKLFLNKYKRILFPHSYSKIFFNFKSLEKINISSNVVSRYICIRLLQRYNLKSIIKPIVQDLTQNAAVAGFKISCCGRFTKKEIAAFFYRSSGSVSLSKATSLIDYAFNEVVLKYSVCGIKVWIQRRIGHSPRSSIFNNFFKQKRNFLIKKKNKIKKVRKLNFYNRRKKY